MMLIKKIVFVVKKLHELEKTILIRKNISFIILFVIFNDLM